MECIQLKIPGMDVEKPENEKPMKVVDMQAEIRSQLMRHTLEMLPVMFERLQEVNKNEDFLKFMIQLLKYSIPAVKSEEMEHLPKLPFDDGFLNRFGVPLD